MSSARNSVSSRLHTNNRPKGTHWARSPELSEPKKTHWVRCLKPCSPKPYSACFWYIPSSLPSTALDASQQGHPAQGAPSEVGSAAGSVHTVPPGGQAPVQQLDRLCDGSTLVRTICKNKPCLPLLYTSCHFSQGGAHAETHSSTCQGTLASATASTPRRASITAANDARTAAAPPSTHPYRKAPVTFYSPPPRKRARRDADRDPGQGHAAVAAVCFGVEAAAVTCRANQLDLGMGGLLRAYDPNAVGECLGIRCRVQWLGQLASCRSLSPGGFARSGPRVGCIGSAARAKVSTTLPPATLVARTPCHSDGVAPGGKGGPGRNCELCVSNRARRDSLGACARPPPRGGPRTTALSLRIWAEIPCVVVLFLGATFWLEIVPTLSGLYMVSSLSQ